MSLFIRLHKQCFPASMCFHHSLFFHPFVCCSVIRSLSSASLVLKQLGDMSLRVFARVRAWRLCVLVSAGVCVSVCVWGYVCKLAESGFGGFLNAGIYTEENQGRRQDQPCCTHTNKTLDLSKGSVFLSSKFRNRTREERIVRKMTSNLDLQHAIIFTFSRYNSWVGDAHQGSS